MSRQIGNCEHREIIHHPKTDWLCCFKPDYNDPHYFESNIKHPERMVELGNLDRCIKEMCSGCEHYKEE